MGPATQAGASPPPSLFISTGEEMAGGEIDIHQECAGIEWTEPKSQFQFFDPLLVFAKVIVGPPCQTRATAKLGSI